MSAYILFLALIILFFGAVVLMVCSIFIDDLVVCTLIAAFACIMVTGSVYKGVQENKKDYKTYSTLLKEKWIKWESYRDNHCNISERKLGIKVPNGRYSATDNFTIYSCENGILYTLEDSHDLSYCTHGDVTCQGNLDYIPEVK